MHYRMLLPACIVLVLSTGVFAQIKVDPQKVSVNASGATSVFLTCGGVAGYVLVEAVWAGEIMDASPGIGMKAVPGTIFGSLPSRYNVSTSSGVNGFTAIMSIPPSITRRAYQAAAGGAASTFYFVCRFVSETGGPDVYVPVTCELGGGGARTPFSLTNVQLAFDSEEPVTTVRPGETLPTFSATIAYTGTAALRGRWEIVRPGDEPPSEWDLLPEASLPIEQRSMQRRYLQVERFNVFLPPTGSYTLRGPDPSLLPTAVSGLHMVVLRIEPSQDVESVSDLAEVGAGPAPIPTGGAAGFSIPPLRYFVGGGVPGRIPPLTLLSPKDLVTASESAALDLVWQEVRGGYLYRIVMLDPGNTVLHSAFLRSGARTYRFPPWLWTKTTANQIMWSVDVLDDGNGVIGKSEWRTVYRPPKPKSP